MQVRIAVLVVLMSALPAFPQKLVTFDAPGAGSIAGSGTVPSAINDRGTITGYVYDNQFNQHGFVMGGGVKATSFDAPGADPAAAGGTWPIAINDFGEITGVFANHNCPLIVNLDPTTTCWHGFVRKANGNFITFDALDNGEFIVPTSINNLGVVTGWYTDLFSEHQFGFYLVPNGKVTPFAEGVIADSINDFGAISGLLTSSDPQSASQGFIRFGSRVTAFQVGTIGSGVDNAFINDFGVVAGHYGAVQTTDHVAEAGYIRALNGQIATFASPGGPTKNLQVYALNVFSVVTGWYEKADLFDLGHAYVRYADGTLVPITMPPGETQSAGVGVNARGVVVGLWHSALGANHGFTFATR